MNFIEGEIILVDKPLNWTSFDVVNKIRYELKKKLGLKKIKVGHAGTLDPLATGLLVICSGNKTKTINQFIQEDKSYNGIIQLGSTTPSFDMETSIDKTFPVTHINEDLIEKIRLDFLNSKTQIPPIFSAKKINGKRAYNYARNNEEITLEPNKINIEALKFDLIDQNQLKFEVKCSKGTYIRSLARDVGEALNSGAHLIKLRRIKSGDFLIKDAKSIDEWIQIINT
ncbi:MAG: tRNA pseudouridine(55) synthase TruB [Crocinitomicaceae bacterium]|nr:tRNA pseudouridine(55) synthase TruB [Crocinitomicaceae bacterium]|tara:strand:- start:1451 stop:2131 length:681 start_codon:yes stop_codon:yes gene_type:complete